MALLKQHYKATTFYIRFSTFNSRYHLFACTLVPIHGISVTKVSGHINSQVLYIRVGSNFTLKIATLNIYHIARGYYWQSF